jgi:uncharacterized repeat protein (TIGR03803 family)
MNQAKFSKSVLVHSTWHDRITGSGLFWPCCAVAALWFAFAGVSHAQTLTTLANFDGTASNPHASLVQGTDGNFYGTTVSGGNSLCNPPLGCGTVFRVTPNGTLAVLYAFCVQTNCADGAGPFGGLVLGTDESFYGTTFTGGDHNCAGAIECGGTVFKITPDGGLITLYSFCAQANCTDGEFPSSALIEGSDQDFYGTASGGGAHAAGTIFKITPQGRLTTLYSFCALASCVDGSDPIGGLFPGADGGLYGTTYDGGAYGYGTVFKLSADGILTTLHSFDFRDGQNPTASLIQASNGKFYGSTFSGGKGLNNCGSGCGSLFAVTSTGKFVTLDHLDWSNGFEPYSPMIQATDGNLYGTTVDGLGVGTIFDTTVGSSSLTTLSAFNGGLDGIHPFAGLLQATNGMFYGTTTGDGSTNGTFFSLDTGLGPFVTFALAIGKIGQTAEILGQGLTGTTSVTFNGVPATTFTIVSDNYITAVVPSSATSGKVVVATQTGDLTSNVNFRIAK